MKCCVCDKPAINTFLLRHIDRMSLIEFLQESAPPIAAAQGRYVLQGQHSRTGQPVAESLTNLSSAVIRASELIGAGYVIDIWSPTSREPIA
jgi:hypothetical protein